MLSASSREANLPGWYVGFCTAKSVAFVFFTEVLKFAAWISCVAVDWWNQSAPSALLSSQRPSHYSANLAQEVNIIWVCINCHRDLVHSFLAYCGFVLRGFANSQGS
jgi:hypothetical protein